MDFEEMSPEELIAQLSGDELQELLLEMGIDTTVEQAMAIKSLVADVGSLEQVMEMLSDSDGQDTAQAA